MTTPSQPSAHEIVWSQLAALARRICDHIEQTPPDLIVVLHKSGVVVGCAVESLWRATRKGPLPRMVAANIGREKGIYLDSDGALLIERSFATAKAAGQFIMGTIMRRPQWPAQLAAQIGVELGDTSVRTILHLARPGFGAGSGQRQPVSCATWKGSILSTMPSAPCRWTLSATRRSAAKRRPSAWRRRPLTRSPSEPRFVGFEDFQDTSRPFSPHEDVRIGTPTCIS